MNFEELGVSKEAVEVLSQLEIVEPTQIQVKAIPAITTGKDVIGISKTGSGKTVAFGIPLVEMIEPKKGLQVLIVAPVRELAVQISTELQKFGRFKRPFVMPIYGGVSIEPQIRNLSRADIVVGTPGRLKDHLQRGTIDFSKIKCVVLDEADKMVEMGFIEDIEILLDHTPQNRQILLFGATISGEIENLKRKYMKDPIIAKTELHVKEEFLQQYYYMVEPFEKFSLLVHLLKHEKPKKAIVFCTMVRTVRDVARNLRMQGINIAEIFGSMGQAKRLDTINAFHRGSIQVLVASAVAARGLDIKDVSHVINYDLSSDPQEYVHRVGRTARCGESGKAITLLGPRDHEAFRIVLDRYRMNVSQLEKEKFARVPFAINRTGGRFNGRRPSRFGNNGSSGYRGSSGGRFRGRR